MRKTAYITFQVTWYITHIEPQKSTGNNSIPGKKKISPCFADFDPFQRRRATDRFSIGFYRLSDCTNIAV